MVLEANTAVTMDLADAAQKWQTALEELEGSLDDRSTPVGAVTSAVADGGTDVYSGLAHLERLIEERRSGLDAFDFISRLFWGAEGFRLWRSRSSIPICWAGCWIRRATTEPGTAF